MNIDQLKKGLQMNRPTVIISNPLCGVMVDIVPIAIVQNPMLYQVKARAPDSNSALSVKSNLKLQPKHQCTARRYRYGNGCLSCTSLLIQAKEYPPYFWITRSVFLKKSAWKIGHAIRKMMDHGSELVPALEGIVEQDEKYIGGKRRYKQGIKHKRGRGTQKHGVCCHRTQ